MTSNYQNGLFNSDCTVESPIQLEVAELFLDRASDYGENLGRAVQRADLEQAQKLICDLFNMCDVLKLTCLYSSLEELRYAIFTCQKSELITRKLNLALTYLQKSVRDLRSCTTNSQLPFG